MSRALINDSETSNQLRRMLKELNLSPKNVSIGWVDMVIVSVTDKQACCLKKKTEGGITGRQAVHLF